MAEANPGRINVGSAGNGADTTMQQLWKFNVGVKKDNTEQEAGTMSWRNGPDGAELLGVDERGNALGFIGDPA